ncbi:MAG: tetratricopeptide repeat protein, partial [Crocosphaera sp.]
MNEERMQSYVTLIQQLLSCPNGHYFKFLMTVLQTIAESKGNPDVIYPLFKENQGMLDETLGTILQQWGQETFKTVSSDQANYMAAVIVTFGNLIQQFPLGNKGNNMELAITAYNCALEVYTREAFPVQWATTQNNLGAAYRGRIKEDKAENLELAITAYNCALEVYTREAFPVDWARTQNNLGNAYSDRIKEDKAENLELAITAYNCALEVRTREAFPVDWAMTQNNLGNAYRDRNEVPEAIACYRNALTIRTPETDPYDCIQTGRNLGNLGFNHQQWDIAIEGYKTAIEAVETARSWAKTDQRRQDILRDGIQMYENIVQCYIN